MMNGVKAVLFLFLAACGGTVSTGNDAAATPDAADELPSVSGGGDGSAADAAIATSCVTDAGAFACDAKAWAWGDAGALCSDMPCPIGAGCYTLGAGSQSGVCE